MTTCAHGREGFCWDELSPEGKRTYDFLYAHAYDYAVRIADRDLAEEYAGYIAMNNCLLPAEDWYSHKTEWRSFTADRGLNVFGEPIR